MNSRELVLSTLFSPYITPLFEYIKENKKVSTYFVCGNATRNIEPMCKCKPDCISNENLNLYWKLALRNGENETENFFIGKCGKLQVSLALFIALAISTLLIGFLKASVFSSLRSYNSDSSK